MQRKQNPLLVYSRASQALMEKGTYKIGLSGVGLNFLELVQEFHRIEPQNRGQKSHFRNYYSLEASVLS